MNETTITRPHVIVLNSASVDGRLALSPERPLLFGDERWGVIEAHAGAVQPGLFELLRKEYQPQANLEGSGSFIVDGEQSAPLPAFNGVTEELFQDYLPQAVLERPNHRGWFTAVDGRGRVRWDYKDGYPDPAWQGWHALVWICQSTPPDYLAYLQDEKIPYLMSGNERVDLAESLEKMRRLLSVTCLLSTAGGRLNGALIRAGLVDEIYLELLPAVIGGLNTPSLFSAPDLGDDDSPVHLRLLSTQTHRGGRIWLHYEVLNANGG